MRNGNGSAAALVALSLLAASIGSAQVAPTDFTNGASLGDYPGWTSSPPTAASVDGLPDPAANPGALRIVPTNAPAMVGRAVLPGELGPWASGSCAVAFADFWVMPAAAPTNAATSIDIDGAKVGFLAAGQSGRAFAFDGDSLGGGAPVPLGFLFPVGGDGAASNWVHVAVRRDYSNGWYDLWIDGILYLAGAGADASPAPGAPALLRFDGDPAAAVRLDLLALSADNPLFADADRDGMPDDFEASRGLDPDSDDRGGDADQDGAANMAEYAAGTAPDDAASVPSASGPAPFYVDGDLGDDLFNGMASHPSAAGGPKRTVGSGLSAVAASGQTGATLVVRGVASPYSQDSIDPGSGSVVLRPTGDVIIQPQP
ncbi:MAG: hypothetical protein IT577_24680 [Verrucomicrobiae bacterium]|nr:hypothetical protein [Verrucomicrobiae bacterium]